MEEMSSRAWETKERIRDAFFELNAEKKIEKISVREITERAHVNRGTFYVYFRDVYDLLEQTQDAMIEDFIRSLKESIGILLKEPERFEVHPILTVMMKHMKYLKVFLGVNGDPKFSYQIKAMAKKNLREVFVNENVSPHKNLDYVLEYITSAQLGLISYWLRNDMALASEEMEQMVKELNLYGPFTYLRQAD